MPRSVPEWIGKNDDEQPPPRVRIRVWERYGRRCAHCTRNIRIGDKWTCDHIKAIINGGENRESLLQPLCNWCDVVKTSRDLAIKSATYRRIISHYGQKEPKGRPLMGTIRSGFKRTFHNGTVRRG
jgi:5-methylcytosine-specific restriction protein A